MKQLSAAAVERAMKLQDVMLRAMAKRITWFQAAEILGISCRQMQRWKTRFEHEGYEGLFESAARHSFTETGAAENGGGSAPFVQRAVLRLNVRHFHEKLSSEHNIQLSYTWVKQALQGAGLVKTRRKRSKHRKRRPRRPLPGMMLHIDGSQHRWFNDERWYDLLVIMDDAADLLDQLPIEVFSGTNTFGDDFHVLHMIAGMDQYLDLANRADS
jgi:transposase